MQNFKLACLTYNPSSVTVPSIRKKPFLRIEAVKVQQDIAEELARVTAERKSRIDQFRDSIVKLDVEMEEYQLKTTKSEEGSPTRFL